MKKERKINFGFSKCHESGVLVTKLLKRLFIVIVAIAFSFSFFFFLVVYEEGVGKGLSNLFY